MTQINGFDDGVSGHEPHAQPPQHCTAPLEKPMTLMNTAKVALVASVLAAGALPWSATAQEGENERVLKGRELSVASLENALELTRTIRVARRGCKRPKDGTGLEDRRPSAALLITFETNSSQLDARSREQLDVVASAIKGEKLKSYAFDIEGHADPRGSTDANLTLSQLRAQSVIGYLIKEHGITAERLRPVGKGDCAPLNQQDASAPENRRVSIVTNGASGASATR